jgi:SSS family solute:Na+ symporter
VNWNFLYVAPLIFLVSLGIVAGVSLVTPPPSESVVKRFVWKTAFYIEESRELAVMPWFKNFRVLSVLLLISTAVFVYFWR